MQNEKSRTLLEFDKKHIWHPYTSMSQPQTVYEVTATKGVYLRLANGKQVIDGMSSWWCAIHGYAHPKLVKAIKSQAKKMAHVMFGGLTHAPAVELSKRIIEITPKGLEHVFLADSGSVSIEAAMKMAIQYQYASNKPEKNKFLTIEGGYHGDTWHAMSVCDPKNGMHSLYGDSLPKQYFAPKPTSKFGTKFDKSDLTIIEKILKEDGNKIAAVILEPVVQGAGGIYFYHPQYLKEVKKLAKKHNVLLIADEIATGFGRTGKLFGCEWAEITPDILCIGKALTGGMMTMAAVVATTDVGKTVSKGGLPFMHGPTFMANPLACAVSIASIDLIKTGKWKKQVLTIERQMKSELSVALKNPKVRDVRVLGAIGVVELHNSVNMEIIEEIFIKKGVWIRPFGTLVYLMPPFIIKPKELSKLTSAIIETLQIDEVIND